MRFIVRCFGLSALIVGIGVNAAPVPVPTPYFATGLPLDTQGRPSAATCASFRSGVYRMISPTLGGSSSDQTGRMTFDAPTLGVVRADGTEGRLEPQGDCRFVDPGVDGYSVDYVVARSGILVGRVTVNGGSSFRNVVGFPEQVHGIGSLAGSWNQLGMRPGTDAFFPNAGRLTFGARGEIMHAVDCGRASDWDIVDCKDVSVSGISPSMPYTADPGGGFVARTPTTIQRLFLYQVSVGRPMLVGIDGRGAFFFAAPVEATSVPEPGIGSRSWNLDMTGQLASATSTYSISSVIVESDSRRQSWTRRKQNIGLPDEHLEKLEANQPRDGYFHRPAGEEPNLDPTQTRKKIRYTEFTALALPGTGFGVLILPAIKVFEFSLFHP